MESLPDRSQLYVREDGFVDVAKLITAYSAEEHAERADRYFQALDDPWTHQLRKPFHDVQDTRATLAGFAAVLELGAIRPGDVVVDFGCGTGWLTVALALMRCRPIGLDISAAALRIARAYADSIPATRADPVRFEVIGERLPLEDGSVDRVICFDAFHHVRDPEGTLAEFARVLRPGGLAVFHEPGPRHSRSPVSQKEMREFAVIENDVVIERLWPAAQACGFAKLDVAAFTEKPVLMDLEDYERRISARSSDEDYAALGRALMEQVREKRVFRLRMPSGEGLDPERDSRAREHLGGELSLTAVEWIAADRLRVSVHVRNAGQAWWRPSGGHNGSVNLGARLARDGEAVRDLKRFDVSATPVLPGETRDLTLELTLPADAQATDTVMLELVAEMVAWFGEVGASAVRVPRVG